MVDIVGIVAELTNTHKEYMETAERNGTYMDLFCANEQVKEEIPNLINDDAKKMMSVIVDYTGLMLDLQTTKKIVAALSSINKD